MPEATWYFIGVTLVEQAQRRRDTPLHRWVARLVAEGGKPEATPLKEPEWLSVEGAREKLRRDGHPILLNTDGEFPLGGDSEATGLHVLSGLDRPGVIRYVGERSDPLALCAGDHVNAALRRRAARRR